MLLRGQVGFLPDSYDTCLSFGTFDYSLLENLGPRDPVSLGFPPAFLTTLSSVYFVDYLPLSIS